MPLTDVFGKSPEYIGFSAIAKTATIIIDQSHPPTTSASVYQVVRRVDKASALCTAADVCDSVDLEFVREDFIQVVSDTEGAKAIEFQSRWWEEASDSCPHLLKADRNARRMHSERRGSMVLGSF